MINQVYVDKLVSLVKQGIINLNEIKIPEYREAVQAQTMPQQNAEQTK